MQITISVIIFSCTEIRLSSIHFLWPGPLIAQNNSPAAAAAKMKKGTIRDSAFQLLSFHHLDVVFFSSVYNNQFHQVGTRTKSSMRIYNETINSLMELTERSLINQFT